MRSLPPLTALALILFAVPVGAQLSVTSDPGRSVRTRDDLERLLSEYQAALASPAYSESVKRSIRVDAGRIQSRLENGDFGVGDRIEIYIQGEANYPDTVTVEPGPMVALDPFGEISLQGVLRSELQVHLAQELSRYIRNPVVRAQGQMRVAILGEVGNPGFYWMPAETVLGDALMMAGGPSGFADLEEMGLQRGQAPLYRRDEVQEALRQGLTLDQLNLQAGDQIFVPAQPTGSIFSSTLTLLGAISSVSALLFFLLN